jgi:hypothetical protein
MKLLRKIGTFLGYSIITVLVAWMLFIIVGILLTTSIMTVDWLTEVLR